MTIRKSREAAAVDPLPRFGTDGWRAIIADQFTFANVRLIAAAMAEHVLVTGGRRIAVGYDTRFLSKEFAQALADTAAAAGIDVLLSEGVCPTPALSWAVKHRKLDAGVMITGSHNPYAYNGVKFKSSYGGPALLEETQSIERHLRKLAKAKVLPTRAGGRVRRVDLMPQYYAQLERYLDVDAIVSQRRRVVFNPMRGAGIGTLDAWLRGRGFDVMTINGDLNPMFAGHGPEPIPANLLDQTAAVKKLRGAIGFATDGDADRFGVLDERGEFVQLHDLMPMLFEHLVETRGWHGGVVRTASMASTVDKIAAEIERPVYESKVGFKYVCDAMQEHGAIIGGEESGGFGYARHMPERDGMLSCLLTLEMLNHRKMTMLDCVRDLRRRFGPFAYKRVDEYCDTSLLARNFEGIVARPPAKVAGLVVDRVSLLDGIKFFIAGDSWMLMRKSDTEPLGRIYVASTTTVRAEKILQAGRKLLFGR